MGPVGRVRPAGAGELPRLQEIEAAAGELFRGVGMTLIADDPPPTIVELARYQADGRIWVVPDPDDVPVGYLMVDIVDGAAHVEQVSVQPSFGRKGIGRMLIDHAGEWARQQNLEALTLTTFTDVPWNGPYYRRLGFEPLDEQDLSPGLRRVRDHERANGLDRWPRVAMRRVLP